MSLKKLPGKNKKEFQFSEEQELMMVCGYITQNHPGILYFCDGAGLLLTKSQAARFARMRSSRGMADLYILKPIGEYHGLIIEFKKSGERIFKENGELVSDKHIQEQASFLEKCEKLNYYSCFVIGYNEAVKVINKYLNGEING